MHAIRSSLFVSSLAALSACAPVILVAPPPVLAGPTPVVPATLVAAAPVSAPACPLGLNPRWSNPEIGRFPLMICIKGNRYPPYLWRYTEIAYGPLILSPCCGC